MLCSAVFGLIISGCVGPYDAQSTRFGDAPQYRPDYASEVYVPQPYIQPSRSYGPICCVSYQPAVQYRQISTYSPQVYVQPVIRRSVARPSPVIRRVISAPMPPPAPRIIAPAVVTTATPAPRPTPIMSSGGKATKTYVRLNGSTSIEDWHKCESSAGGYSSAGFESCMRSRGYVSESEAISILEAREVQ